MALQQVRLKVRVDMDLQSVEIDVIGLIEDLHVMLGARPALDLALRLLGAVGRIERLGREP
jgi:hypothetical protein